ncbi:MAG: DUF1501 domain-containing protein [Cyanobacteria bacterium P01_D01_bin.14]
MKRRQFLTHMMLAGAAAVGSHGLAWRNPALAASSNRRLVVVFLRGAIDGLNVLVPYQSAEYYQTRPNIAIAPPGKSNGAIDLDGFYGLHPLLSDLYPLWQSGQLAFVQAAGSPHPTRSHFEAQAYMETGVLDDTVDTGWMNRLLTRLQSSNPTQTVSVNRSLPLILTGEVPSASISIDPRGYRPLQIDNATTRAAFDQLYQGSDPVQAAYRTGRAARDQLLNSLENVAPLSNAAGFVNSAHYLAQLMRGQADTQIAYLELGSWDTHIGQANTNNRLLPQLGQGLATLKNELGPLFDQTTVVVMSEFGRTVEQNGSLGTDHGHGNMMMVLGGQVNGKTIYGDWPGLAPAERYEGRDLAITTDFRDVVGSVLGQHMQLSGALDEIFPGHAHRQLPLMG